jgi:hypothetical protein
MQLAEDDMTAVVTCVMASLVCGTGRQAGVMSVKSSGARNLWCQRVVQSDRTTYAGCL